MRRTRRSVLVPDYKRDLRIHILVAEILSL
jgi:hypothetical protein